MSQYIRLCKYSLHVPSVARARLLPTAFLRRPQIYVEYFNGCSFEVNYPMGVWTTAQKDYEGLLNSMQTCQKALSQVNLIEPIPEKKALPAPQNYPVCVNPPKFDYRSPPSIA